jgi:hypothetical protein
VKSFAIIFAYLLIVLSDWPLVSNAISFPIGMRQIVVLVLPLFLLLLQRKLLKIKIPNEAILILFLISAQYSVGLIYSAYAGLKYFLGFVMTYLFYLIYILSANIKISEKDINYILHFIMYFTTATILQPFIAGVINFENLRWHPSLYRELGAMAISTVFSFAIALFYYKETNLKKYLIIALFCAIVVFMTVLKKSIIEIFIVFLFIMTGSFRSRKAFIFIAVTALIVSSPLLINSLMLNIVENQDYYNNVGFEDHVRTGMYFKSFLIAIDYFPLGSGFGSFGSLSSVFGEYSKIYTEYGADLIGSNSESDVIAGSHTLLDTFWPHILAEAGFVGAMLYIYMLYKIKLPSNCKYNKIGNLFIIIAAFDSIFLYSLELPLVIFYFSFLVGIFKNIKYK